MIGPCLSGAACSNHRIPDICRSWFDKPTTSGKLREVPWSQGVKAAGRIRR
jgi:hypothetical protein